MNKKIIVGLLTIGTIGFAGGRQLFTPLSLTWDARQYLHDDKGGGKWVDPDLATKTGKNWNFDLWSAGYNRYADMAYTCNGSCPCMTPLTTLFFGKSRFILREIFADSTIVAHVNPWVSVSEIRPRIEYNEQGAYFGANWGKDFTMFKRTFHIGIRGNMPVKSVEVARQYDGSDVEREIETKDDAVRYSIEQMGDGATTVKCFAYRYDLVNALEQNQTTGEHMIIYDQGGSTSIRIAGVEVGVADYPAHVKGGGSTGTPPAIPFSATSATVTAATPLAADGSGVGADSRARFVSTTDYATLNTTPANQRLLWIVPTQNAGSTNLSAGAQTIMSAVENALATVEDSVVDYLTHKGIDLGTQKTMGAGDTLLQLYLQRNWHQKKIFTETHFGAVLPTGVKTSSTLKPFCLPLGNNGHYEVELGADLGWNACKWAALQAGFSYHWALSGRECVAAPFDGACVKNLGPSVPANISWQYLLVDGGLTLVEPTHHHFGMNATYEYYYKKCDNICLCATQAVDLEDNTQDLCANNLTWLTKQQAHKIKTDFFFNKQTGSIFGGFDYIFAGKNAPKEIGWHMGLMIEF